MSKFIQLGRFRNDVTDGGAITGVYHIHIGRWTHDSFNGWHSLWEQWVDTSYLHNRRVDAGLPKYRVENGAVVRCGE